MGVQTSKNDLTYKCEGGIKFLQRIMTSMPWKTRKLEMHMDSIHGSCKSSKDKGRIFISDDISE